MIDFFQSTAMVESVKKAQETKHVYKNVNFSVQLEKEYYTETQITSKSQSVLKEKIQVVSRK